MRIYVLAVRWVKCTMAESSFPILECIDAEGREVLVDPFFLEGEVEALVGRGYELKSSCTTRWGELIADSLTPLTLGE